MKAERRSRLQIYFDILQLLCKKAETGESPCPTRIAHQANLSYDRFRDCLDQLVQLDMVSRQGGRLIVTKKGIEYIQWHRRMNSFLKQMGLLS